MNQWLNTRKKVAEIIQKDPAVEHVMSAAGAGRNRITSNSGTLLIKLKSKSERKDTPDDILKRLRPELAKIPGIKVYLQNPPAIRIGGSVSKGLYQYTLQSTDIKELYEWAPVIEKRMKDVPGLLDVSTDLQISGPQIFIDIDRKRQVPLV